MAHDIFCTLAVNPNSITAQVAPFKAMVTGVKGGPKVTVKWKVNGPGTTFTVDGFRWKDGGGPGFLPTPNPANTELTIEYDLPATPVTWRYKVSFQTDNAVVDIDPDIHNDPPPDDEEEDDTRPGNPPKQP